MSTQETVDEGSPAFLVVQKFGSRSKLAQLLGKQPSTVRRWIEFGNIPPRHHRDVFEAGKKCGIALGPNDFVDMRIFANG